MPINSSLNLPEKVSRRCHYSDHIQLFDENHRHLANVYEAVDLCPYVLPDNVAPDDVKMVVDYKDRIDVYNLNGETILTVRNSLKQKGLALKP